MTMLGLDGMFDEVKRMNNRQVRPQPSAPHLGLGLTIKTQRRHGIGLRLGRTRGGGMQATWIKRNPLLRAAFVSIVCSEGDSRRDAYVITTYSRPAPDTRPHIPTPPTPTYSIMVLKQHSGDV